MCGWAAGSRAELAHTADDPGGCPTGNHTVNSETSRSLATLPCPATTAQVGGWHPDPWEPQTAQIRPAAGARAVGVEGGSPASAGPALRESLFSYGPLDYQRFSPFLGTWCATCLPKKKGGRRKNPQQTSYNPKRVFQVSTLAFSPKRGELVRIAA